jgi:hypothetical protein
VAPALILTAAKAEERGFTGEGPFTLGGAFPGIYSVGQPLALSELGFQSEGEAHEAFEEAFGDDSPLEWTEVGEGEGRALRENHALSEIELAEHVATGDVRDSGGEEIRTHAQADEAANDLGLTFPSDPRPTVAEKVAAIEQARAAAGVVLADGAEG